MLKKTLILGSILPVLIALGGCEVSKSANPLSPSLAGPIAGVEISAPRIMAPDIGSEIPVEQQPLTLTVGNSSSSGVRLLSYRFEISNRENFGTILYTKTAVAPGDG